ncbi:MAG: LysR family transcriptional regulator [Alphaproteobacteria bacterium]|nr:MAG: LysR family transcriptional regulator [Alphaproteobacteria bacterium]
MPRPDAITLKQLRALGAVARFGSITKAAEAIRLTPPAVHTQLKQLSANIGAELVTRGASGKMVLTEEGALVLESVRRIEVELDACVRSVGELRDGYAGLVQIAVVSTGKYFAPGLVMTLKEAFPDIKVELMVGNREQTIAALESRQAHMAIMGRPPRFPLNHSEMIGPHPHVMIARPDHWLAGRHPVAHEDLIDEHFIIREEGSGSRALALRFLDRIGEGRVHDVTTMSTNETIKQAVMAGLGIAILSEHTIIEELKSGRLVKLDVPGMPIERAWYLITRADVPLSAAARRISAHISQMKGSFLPKLEELRPDRA